MTNKMSLRMKSFIHVTKKDVKFNIIYIWRVVFYLLETRDYQRLSKADLDIADN